MEPAGGSAADGECCHMFQTVAEVMAAAVYMEAAAVAEVMAAAAVVAAAAAAAMAAAVVESHTLTARRDGLRVQAEPISAVWQIR